MSSETKKAPKLRASCGTMALHAGDDEGAVRRHHRHVREKNLLRLLRAECLVDKLHGRLYWRFVGAHVIARELFVIFRFANVKAFKLEFKLFSRVVSDGRKFFEEFLETVLQKPVKRRPLMPDEVWERNRGSPICTECFLDEGFCMRGWREDNGNKIYKCKRTEIYPLALMRLFGSRMNLLAPPSITHSYLVPLPYHPPPFCATPLGINKTER